MHRFSCLGLSAIILTQTFSFQPALAQEGNGFWDKDRWQVRLRAAALVPDEESTLSIGGDAKVDNQIMPEVDVTYFFTDHVSAELIAAVFNHKLTADDTNLGDLDLGDAWVIPPTLTLQYHFTPDNEFSPYVGAGVNYTIFTREDNGDSVNDLDVDNAFGWALQAGMDYWIDDHWGLNLDAKKIYMETDVSINNGAITGDVDMDPWVLSAGISYRF